VLENCTPGSVRGAPGNRRPYLATTETIVRHLGAVATSCAIVVAQSSHAQSTYTNAVLADNPVAYWRLDEPQSSTNLLEDWTLRTGGFQSESGGTNTLVLSNETNGRVLYRIRATNPSQ